MIDTAPLLTQEARDLLCIVATVICFLLYAGVLVHVTTIGMRINSEDR